MSRRPRREFTEEFKLQMVKSYVLPPVPIFLLSFSKYLKFFIISLVGFADFFISNGYSVLFLYKIKSISSVSLFLKCEISNRIPLLS